MIPVGLRGGNEKIVEMRGSRERVDCRPEIIRRLDFRLQGCCWCGGCCWCINHGKSVRLDSGMRGVSCARWQREPEELVEMVAWARRGDGAEGE